MNTLLRTTVSNYLINIKLFEGDITLSDAEAITNPANSQLAHGGGLAGLLARKAGPALQAESTQWVQAHGPVSHQSPAYTSAGDLAFKAVIHAVGPVWGSGEEEAKLKAAVSGSLHLAEKLGLRSLAIPAISTGIFRYPVDQAARVILTSARDFAPTKADSSLQEIQIIVFGDQPAAVFQQVWDENIT